VKVLGFDNFFGPLSSCDRGRKLKKLENAKWQTLEDDTIFQSIPYAKGSQFKVFETKNFGWVVFHQDTKTPEGHTPGRLIHKY
jgi:hypothetical protein